MTSLLTQDQQKRDLIDPSGWEIDQGKTEEWLEKVRRGLGLASGVVVLARDIHKTILMLWLRGGGGGRLGRWCRSRRRGRGLGRLRWRRRGGCVRGGRGVFGWDVLRGYRRSLGGANANREIGVPGD